MTYEKNVMLILFEIALKVYTACEVNKHQKLIFGVAAKLVTKEKYLLDHQNQIGMNIQSNQFQ